MTRKDFYLGVAAVVAALVIGMVLHALISSKREDAARLEQVQQDVKPIHQEAAAEKDSAEKQQATAKSAEDTNQKLLAAALAALAAQRQQPLQTQVDYDRIDRMIAQQLGGGVQVRSQPAKDAAGNILPDAPSQVVISGPNATKAVNDYQLGCQESKERLGSCYDTVKNTTDTLNAEVLKYNAEVKDHNATKQELAVAKRGGTRWQRIRGAVKGAVCGSAGTAAGIEVAKKNGPWTGVAIGAGAFGACQLMTRF